MHSAVSDHVHKVLDRIVLITHGDQSSASVNLIASSATASACGSTMAEKTAPDWKSRQFNTAFAC